MKVGIPSEIKAQESRVGLTPKSVQQLTNHGHEVLVENNAGFGAGFENADYEKAGAKIASSAADVFNDSDMIVKVKEPQSAEVNMLRENQILFTYLHLSAAPELTKGLVDSKSICIAYETVTADDGSLPLLAPMSAIAGQLSIVVGSYHLLKPNNGRGTLLSELDPRIVTVIGAGVAGKEAILKAKANHAKVRVVDLNPSKLKQLKNEFGEEGIEFIISSPDAIKKAVSDSDLVIGSVYVVGKEAPKVVTNEMLGDMEEGSVLVDISIDQGGCFESSRPTTHDNPTFLENDIVHYCVTNMPGAVPLTATQALNKVTLSYIEDLANKGVKNALTDDVHLRNGLNIQNGEITHPAVKDALNN